MLTEKQRTEILIKKMIFAAFSYKLTTFIAC